MAKKGILVITLLVVLIVVLIMATYSWMTYLYGGGASVEITSNKPTDILIDVEEVKDWKTNSQIYSTPTEIYSGQKGFYYDEQGNSVRFEDKSEDAPYWFLYNLEYTAKASENLTIKLSLAKVEVDVYRKNLTVESLLRDYLEIEVENDDYTGYLQIYSNNTYFEPQIDKGLYFITTDIDKEPTKTSFVDKVIFKTAATQYFEFKWWESEKYPKDNLDKDGIESLTLSSNKVNINGVKNYIRIKIGYYGYDSVRKEYKPFAFSNARFMGSTFKFYLQAIGE